MVRISLASAVAALSAVAAAVALPPAGTEIITIGSAQDDAGLKIFTLKIEAKKQGSVFDGLYATPIFAGPGASVLIGLPLGFGEHYHYNETLKTIFQPVYGRLHGQKVLSPFSYDLSLPKVAPRAPGFHDYFLAAFNETDRDIPSRHGFYFDDKKRLQMKKKPESFESFALCSVERIPNQYVTRFYQLLWRTGSAMTSHLCEDVYLSEHKTYTAVTYKERV